MHRERVLKVVLVLVGLLFTAGIYPLALSLSRQEPEDYGPMMLSVYVTLGIFLLLAARNPSSSRNLIAFTAWSSFAHAGVMSVQATFNKGAEGDLLGGAAALVIIGLILIVLAPVKLSGDRASIAGT